MALLYIREYKRQGKGLNGHQIAAGEEPGTDQTPVAIGGGSLQSAAFAADTLFVRVHTDAICSISFGSNPTAVTNSSARMAAGTTEFFAVQPTGTLGTTNKIAVISST
jgi:hypothetical protein